MPTDLKHVRDHPVAVLHQAAAEAYARGDTEYGNHYTMAAARLVTFEVETGRTFAALDNEALRDVYEAYDGYASRHDSLQSTTGFKLFIAICDLLGLED